MLEVLVEEKEKVLEGSFADVWMWDTVKLNQNEYISNPILTWFLILFDESHQFFSLFYLPKFLGPLFPLYLLIENIILLQQGYKHLQLLIESFGVASQFPTKIKSKIFF